MDLTSSTSLAPLLAANFPAYPDLGENVSFILIGFGFVMLVLLFLAGLTSGIGSALSRASKGFERPAPPAPVAAAAPTPTEQPGEADFAGHSHPDHVPALIAAAVHVMLQGRKHRIKGVRVTSGRWAQEGRRDIFSSHKVR